MKKIIVMLSALGMFGYAWAQADTAANSSPSSNSSPSTEIPKNKADVCLGPEYPAESLRAKNEGAVTVQYTVSAEGKVIGTQVVKSSGFDALDQATMKAFSLCKFKPGRNNEGIPIESSVKMKFIWKIPE